jgi:hypothetical protein
MAATFTALRARVRRNPSKFENVSRIDRSRFRLCLKVISTEGLQMSPRSIYLRDQAGKLQSYADRMADVETKEQLRVLAAAFIMRAVAIESEEPSYGARK